MREIEAQFSSVGSSTSNKPTLLSEITTPDKARELFKDRRSKGAEANSKFDSGNHYQNGDGYIGAKPLYGTAGYSQTMAQIEAGFVSENVIKEVTDRHIAGLLGREPLWGFLPFDAPSPDAERRRTVFSKIYNLVRTVAQKTSGNPDDKAQEADEALTSAWWNTRKVRESLKKAVRTALLEERATVKFFFPVGNAEKNARITIQTKNDLPSALTIPQIDVLTSDKAGVFTDDFTQEEFGVHVYKVDEETDAASVTYIQNGLTILKVMVDKQADQLYSFELGGRLLMYEITRDALITDQIRSLQKALNLSRTMMVRNVNLAGSLERTILNAERPKETKKVLNSEQTAYIEQTVDADYLTGAGATMFLTGMLIRDDQGNVINRANPNISFRDPVSTKTFTETRDDLYAAMLAGCQQRFALISGDATASGRSRIEARSEFESSLKDSKDAIDDAGRWLLETQLRLGAIFCNRSRDFLPLRCDFNAVIETGPITPEERQENRADVQAGLLSKETAMSLNGRDDTDAELERIAQEPAPQMPPTNPNQPGQQPPLIG